VCTTVETYNDYRPRLPARLEESVQHQLEGRYFIRSTTSISCAAIGGIG
jgi:hypothetical protein